MKVTAPLMAFLLLTGGQAAVPRASKGNPPFNVVEASIADMQAAHEGRPHHLARARPAVPHAHRHLRGHAARGDHRQPERARGSRRAAIASARQGRVRGPLHGIPIALKDNIHTTDMPTTGGALAFEGLVPPYEATLTKNLRDAGAIIIAKTGMTELANWVAGADADAGQLQRRRRLRLQPVRSAPRSARRDLRRPAGAADRRLELRHRHRRELLGRQRRHRDVRLDPQPVEPEHARGIKPTVGRISRYGVIPITADQDTRRPDGEVRDATPRSCSARSRARRPIRTIRRRRTCTPPPNRDYTKFLKARRPEGRAHRHPARVLLRPRSRCPVPTDAARRPQPRAEEGDGRRDRRAQGSRARSSSIPPTSRASSTRIPKNNFLLGRLLRHGRRARTRLLGRLQVRHEARLQHVAGVARRRRRR